MLLMSDWRVVTEAPTLMNDLLDSRFKPAQTLLLESRPDPRPAPGRPQGLVHWMDLSTDQTEITADVPHPELLFITDNFSRGWHVEALPDSAQNHYQVLPADYFLRAIPLGRGHHHFLLEYRPLAFEAGKWVSIVSCFLYVGVLLSLLKRHLHSAKVLL